MSTCPMASGGSIVIYIDVLLLVKLIFWKILLVTVIWVGYSVIHTGCGMMMIRNFLLWNSARSIMRIYTCIICKDIATKITPTINIVSTCYDYKKLLSFRNHSERLCHKPTSEFAPVYIRARDSARLGKDGIASLITVSVLQSCIYNFPCTSKICLHFFTFTDNWNIQSKYCQKFSDFKLITKTFLLPYIYDMPATSNSDPWDCKVIVFWDNVCVHLLWLSCRWQDSHSKCMGQMGYCYSN